MSAPWLALAGTFRSGLGLSRAKPRAFRPFVLPQGRESRLEQRFCVARRKAHFHRPLSEAGGPSLRLIDRPGIDVDTGDRHQSAHWDPQYPARGQRARTSTPPLLGVIP